VVGVLETVGGVIEILERVVAELEPATFDGPRAASLVEALARGERLCAAGKTLMARRVDNSNVWRHDGHRSGAHWLAAATGVSVGAATATLATAAALDALPSTADAFRAGELSAQQAIEITAAGSADPDRETLLLDTAQSSSLKGLRDRCREVRAAAVDDVEAARRLHATRRVHVWLDAHDGAYRADVRLHPEAGARFDAALTRKIDEIFTAARRAGRQEPRAAYAADALVALVCEGPSKPIEVKLTVDHGALVRGHLEPGERCEVDGLGTVPVTVARSLLDDALISVLVRDGTEITTVTSPKRTIPASLRRALEAKYPACGNRGCDNSQYLQIDHIVPIAEGGPTTIGNTWRLCTHDHDLKTYAGWRVVGSGDERRLIPPPHSRCPPEIPGPVRPDRPNPP
jgi:hypothetical protein